MRKKGHIRFAGLDSGPELTIMGLDEEAVRIRFDKRLAEIASPYDLFVFGGDVSDEANEYLGRVREAGASTESS